MATPDGEPKKATEGRSSSDGRAITPDRRASAEIFGSRRLSQTRDYMMRFTRRRHSATAAFPFGIPEEEPPASASSVENDLDEAIASLRNEPETFNFSDRRYPFNVWLTKDQGKQSQRKALCSLNQEYEEREIDLAVMSRGDFKRQREYKLRKEILKQYSTGPKREPIKSRLSLDNLNSIFKLRKDRKRSQSELLHLMRLAIIDQKHDVALDLASRLPEKGLGQRHPVMVAKVFIRAAVAGWEDVTLAMMQRGFPDDVNLPIFVILFPGETERRYKCPSFFMLALALGLEELVKAMLKNGAIVDATWYGITPLMIAAAWNGKGNARLVNLLLECGADPLAGIPFNDYNTILRLQINRSKVVPFAKQPSVPGYSANANGVAKSKASTKVVFPLDIGVAVNNKDVVLLLAMRTPRQGISTSSFSLVARQNTFIMAYLLEAGADVRQTGGNGCNALHIAARRGDYTAICLLLFYGMLVNDKGEHGWTALHEAVASRHIACARLLVRRGARVDRTDENGLTPREIGKTIGLTDCELDEYLDVSKPSEFDMAEEPDIPALIATSKAYRPSQRLPFTTKLEKKRHEMATVADMRRLSADVDLKGKLTTSGRFSNKRRSFSVETDGHGRRNSLTDGSILSPSHLKSSISLDWNSDSDDAVSPL